MSLRQHTAKLVRGLIPKAALGLGFQREPDGCLRALSAAICAGNQRLRGPGRCGWESPDAGKMPAVSFEAQGYANNCRVFPPVRSGHHPLTRLRINVIRWRSKYGNERRNSGRPRRKTAFFPGLPGQATRFFCHKMAGGPATARLASRAAGRSSKRNFRNRGDAAPICISARRRAVISRFPLSNFWHHECFVEFHP